MPKKQPNINETAPGAASPRATKPKAPRVRTTKHSKTQPLENVVTAVEQPTALIERELVEEDVILVASQNANSSGAFAERAIAREPEIAGEDAHSAISKIAYSYWEARGYTDGSPLEDWVRAEQEYRGQAGSNL